MALGAVRGHRLDPRLLVRRVRHDLAQRRLDVVAHRLDEREAPQTRAEVNLTDAELRGEVEIEDPARQKVKQAIAVAQAHL